MTTSPYRYQMEILKYDYTLLGQMPVNADWQPAVEWARLTALRSGGPIECMTAPCAVEPVWHPQVGQPYISGFRVALEGGSFQSSDFPFTYWKSLADAASTVLVSKGCLQDGDKYRYRVTAFPCDGDTPSDLPMDVGWEEVPPDLHIIEARLADFVSGSTPVGRIHPADIPVFIPRQVIEETSMLKEEAGAVETGSILIGHICIDRQLPSPEVFVVVTAQLPARHTSSELTSITFTADTWSDVHDTIALRNRGELMVSWSHTHPTRHFCTCESCDRSTCSLEKEFFSADDLLLHRTVFPRAWTTALVMSDVRVAPDAWTDSCALYGWRKGAIAERGFYETTSSPLPRIMHDPHNAS